MKIVNRHKHHLLVILVLAFALFSRGCYCTSKVKYVVSGTAENVQISYTNGSNDVKKSSKSVLPWKKTQSFVDVWVLAGSSDDTNDIESDQEKTEENSENTDDESAETTPEETTTDDDSTDDSTNGDDAENDDDDDDADEDDDDGSFCDDTSDDEDEEDKEESTTAIKPKYASSGSSSDGKYENHAYINAWTIVPIKEEMINGVMTDVTEEKSITIKIYVDGTLKKKKTIKGKGFINIDAQYDFGDW